MIKVHVALTTVKISNKPHHEKTNIFAYAKNKGADQLCSNFEADQHLCFHNMESIIPF